MVCSSSDLPEPVVPATRPCGPSRRRSMLNGPSIEAPTTAAVVDPPTSQRAATASGVGGSRPRTSSSRQALGSAPSSPESLTSRIGATARATRWNQPGGTTSARTPSSVSARCWLTSSPVALSAMTAVHSSGSNRRSASRQML